LFFVVVSGYIYNKIFLLFKFRYDWYLADIIHTAKTFLKNVFNVL